MTREEIVTALRCCANHTDCNSCELRNTGECLRIMPASADRIENQQREIEALRNELCQHCGKYKQAHEGACNGCRWKQ